MSIFRDKNSELKKQLLASQGGFRFDQTSIKRSVLETIEEQQLNQATQRLEKINRKSFFRQHQMAALTLGIIFLLTASSATMTQFNFSNPGGRLHVIDQMQEQVLLNMPIPEAQKIDFGAKMVEERNKELDHIIEQQDQNNIKLEAVKESQDALNNAIDRATNAKESSVQKNKPEQTEKYNQALNRLGSLAEEQEKRVENLRKIEKNENAQKELDKYLEAIKQAKQRAKNN